MPIGHDIVSLNNNIPVLTKRHGKKTLHLSEYHYWQLSNFSSSFYWSCWAIKEAIYKLNMKVSLIESFIFPEFDSQLAQRYQYNKDIHYSFNFQKTKIFIKLQQGPTHIQAFASTVELSQKNFTSLFFEKRKSDQSKVVQKLITDFIPNSAIHFKNWRKRARIPYLYINNQKSVNHDISFSHDGLLHSSCILLEEQKQ